MRRLCFFCACPSLTRRAHPARFVSTEHLLQGVALDSRFGSALFRDLGVSAEKLAAAVAAVRGKGRVTDAGAESKYELLSKYARDLTAEARAGKLDPVIGRDDESAMPMPHPAVPACTDARRSLTPRLQFGAPSRSCLGAPRTTRCSSASRAWARRPSARGWRSASWRAMCRLRCRTAASWRWTWAACLRAPSLFFQASLLFWPAALAPAFALAPACLRAPSLFFQACLPF